MIFNDEKYDIGKVEANYGYFIEIISKDNKISINFCFNENKYDFKNMKINDSIDLNNYLYWDTTLVVEKNSYVFDITKDKINITKVDDNKYKFDAYIENPDMFFSRPSKYDNFKNLIINTEFSFNYNYKPKKDDSILKVPTHKSNVDLMDALDRM